jgi:hypothetical protein
MIKARRCLRSSAAGGVTPNHAASRSRSSVFAAFRQASLSLICIPWVSPLSAAIAAAEHMPAIFEEWIAAKESGAWNSAYLKQHMAIIDLELARAYYDRNESYGLKEMKADVAKIKAAMMSAKHF